MYKYILLALIMFTPVFVGASHEVNINGKTISHGGGDPNKVVQSWGLTGYETPLISAGSVVYDRHGVPSECPEDYARGCMDITGTDMYVNGMLELARQLVDRNVWQSFPRFAGWVAEVRGR